MADVLWPLTSTTVSRHSHPQINFQLLYQKTIRDEHRAKKRDERLSHEHEQRRTKSICSNQ